MTPTLFIYPFPNESFIQVVTLAKALSKQTTLMKYESS